MSFPGKVIISIFLSQIFGFKGEASRSFEGVRISCGFNAIDVTDIATQTESVEVDDYPVPSIIEPSNSKDLALDSHVSTAGP